MGIYQDLLDKKTKLSLVGLGYVGLPIAVAFADHLEVLAFDINQHKVDLYKKGVDSTLEVGDDRVQASSAYFTSQPNDLEEASFHIVAVPTPVNGDHTPDLRPVIGATRTLGQHLRKGSYVVYESTVFPGVTEEVCVPILEEESGLKCGQDFKVGYSPERINPGDKVHRLDNIIKIVSGSDEAALNEIAAVYELVVDAGVYRAPSIKVAEAAKVIENSQRDVNIAFMNELSMIFNKMGIDTQEVLEAAGSKWNFLPFSPGLVGGHCIGIDPYYLTYKAEQLGYHSEIILSGRRINDQMGNYVVENLIKEMIDANILIKQAKIAILGFTFKADVPDVRNTKVLDIYNEIRKYGVQPIIVDPVADAHDAKLAYGIELEKFDNLEDCDVVIIAVDHQDFKKLSQEEIGQLFGDKPKQDRVILDLKGILNKDDYVSQGYHYWRL